MKQRKPQTLKRYIDDCSINFLGKQFQSNDSVYTINGVYSDIKTRDLIADVEECDLGDMGHVTNRTLNLTHVVGMHDCEELIEGVNAERTNPWIYYGTSI